MATYDPDYERESPGMILMLDCIQWSFDHKFHTVDVLYGAEGFRSRFASQTVTLGCMADSRTLLGRAAMMVDAARHRIKPTPVTLDSTIRSSKSVSSDGAAKMH